MHEGLDTSAISCIQHQNPQKPYIVIHIILTFEPLTLKGPALVKLLAATPLSQPNDLN